MKRPQSRFARPKIVRLATLVRLHADLRSAYPEISEEEEPEAEEDSDDINDDVQDDSDGND